MIINKTYSKKKYKKKRRKPIFEALLKVKNDESDLSLFGALNAKNIKKVKASIRNNVKCKENEKTKAAKKSCKGRPIVFNALFNETLDDTFDRLFTNSESRKPKHSTPDGRQGTVESCSNTKQKSLLDLHSSVFHKNQSTYMQKYTEKRQANIFHFTSTPISSPSLDLDNGTCKFISEQKSVNQQRISSLFQLSASFLNLSVQLRSANKCASLGQLKSHPENIIGGSPDMFSSCAEDSLSKTNLCLRRKEYSNRQLTNVLFDSEPSLQVISDLSLNVSSSKYYPFHGSNHVSSQENIFETHNLNVNKEEKLEPPEINIFKRKMTKTARIELQEHTEPSDDFDKICGWEEHTSGSSLEANDVSKIISSKSSSTSASRMKTCSLNNALSNNTSSSSDVLISPALSLKNNNFEAKNSKSKKRSTVKASKKITFKRRFYSAGSMENKALMNATRKIKSVDNIQAIIEHKENIDPFNKITDPSLEANDISKIISSKSSSTSSRMKTCSLNTALSNNTPSRSDVLISPALSLKINNFEAKNSKSKKRSTVKASKKITFKRRFYSAGSMTDKTLSNASRKIKSVDIFQGPPRKKCNPSNESCIVLSSETSESEVDLENNVCDNSEEDIYTVSGQSGSDSDVFSYSNNDFNTNKKLGMPKYQTKKATNFSPLSLARNTCNATSTFSSHLLDISLSSTDLSFDKLKYKENGKNNNKNSLCNKKKVSCKRRVYSEENKTETLINEASRRKIKSVSDNISGVPTPENNVSFWKKNKRMSIARRQSHLVKEICFFKDDESCNLFRTSFALSSCPSVSSIHNHLNLSPRKLLDAVTEDVVENKSPTNSIKSSSNSIETDNNAWDTASISCSVLLCNTVDCDTRERSCNSVNELESQARDFILQKCGQSYPLLFSEVFTNSYLENCKKIGEGVYGEVFLCDHMDGRSTILKIIPIEGDVIVNGEKQKKFHEILTEVLIASELSDLRYDSLNNTDIFSEFIKCWCVVGSYPDKLIQLWNEFSAENGTENDSPIILDENQLFLVLELRNGGKPLESYVFNSAEQSSSLLLQVAFGLAVAESAVEFEHRDLHWGNVLVAPTQSKTIEFVLNGSEFVIPSKGVKATIIDFTLSRMLHKRCCIYNDLSLDPGLFTATGEYQFEIYRLMKDKIRSKWINFEPFTNVLWLHYLLDKCLKAVYYHRKNTKVHKKYTNILKVWFNEVMESSSATHFVTHKNYC